MKIKNSSFVTSAVRSVQYPSEDLPEIAFVGRSNVGKSSIINMLLGRKGLAKTSGTPGKTQLVNFFDIDGLFRFVDLPGYGFAKVSKSIKENWGKIIGQYLNSRPNLLEIVALLDIRHIPTTEDLEMYNWITQMGYSGIIICTKSDKLSNAQKQKQIKVIRKKINLPQEQKLFLSSATSRAGKYQIWDEINLLFENRGIDIFLERQEVK